MASIQTNERLQQALSITLEQRLPGYQDLVSRDNAMLALMKARGMWKPYHGPTIRQTIKYQNLNNFTWYDGYDFLNPRPRELFADAEWTPKQGATSVTLSGRDIRDNSGPGQRFDILKETIEAAEEELAAEFEKAVHGDGTGGNGKAISGLKVILPTDPTTGTYGSINRATTPIWRPKAFDIQTDFGASITQLTKDNVFYVMSKVMISLMRGKKGPTFALMSPEHYAVVEAALVSIQRITDNNSELGRLGFPAYEFVVAGKRLPFVLDAGQTTQMPSNTTYFIDVNALEFRYHPELNFDKIGGKQMPINQDAIVQHIGFMGELILKNPLHSGKLYDSNPAA
jgi:hypothetical protein